MKAKRIQTGIWSSGLYAADTHFIGMRHFKRLRRAAANAMLGVYHHANPFIACLCLSKYLQDPFLYVIVTALRSVRRMFQFRPGFAQRFITAVSDFDANKTYGPASALSKYLEKIQAWVDIDANVMTQQGLLLSLRTSSCKEIKNVVSMYWSKMVFECL